MQLVTERLILRDIHPGDWQTIAAYNADPEMHRYTLPGQGQEKHVRRWLRIALRSTYRTPRIYYGLAIAHRESDVVIGTCVLAATKIGGSANIGWELNRAFWNQGYTTEAAQALAAFGFSHLNLRSITADCFVGNRASIRVMEKIGMQRVRRGTWYEWLLGLSYGLLQPTVRHIKFRETQIPL